MGDNLVQQHSINPQSLNLWVARHLARSPSPPSPSRGTEADFQTWRDKGDWTAGNYALWDAGKRLELPSHGPGKPVNRFRKCLCGAIFDMRGRMKHCAHASSYYCRQAVLSAPQRANVN